MASILTNASSMAALQTLRSIDSNMSTTQSRISSGLKVGSASDNAAYWSIATTMRVESSSLAVVGETLGMGSSIADTATMATESVLKNLKELRQRVTAAGDQTNDKAKILTEINEIGFQMDAAVKGANFNGVNWLTAKDSANTDLTASTKVLSGITRGQLDFITVTLDSTAIAAVAAVAPVAGPPAIPGTPGTPALPAGNVQEIVDTVKAFTDADLKTPDDVQKTLSKLDVAIKAVTELGAKFGAVSSRIDTQKDYIGKLTKAIDRGVGSLVDADMNEESTRLKALQTQQQLAVQSLSIANSSSEKILQLFR